MTLATYKISNLLTTEFAHTGDTNWTDVQQGGSDVEIADTQFENGKDYLLLVAFEGQSNSNTNTETGIRVVHGTTPFTNGEQLVEPIGTRKRGFHWWSVWTAVVNEGIKIQIQTLTSSRVANLDNGGIIAIKLSDEHTENTHYWHDKNANQTILGTTWSTSNNATKTFIPTNVGRHLVLGRGVLAVNSVTSHYQTRIFGTVGSTTEPSQSSEGEDDSEVFQQVQMRVFDLTDQEYTFRSESQDPIGPSGEREESEIFILDLSQFREIPTGTGWDGTELDQSSTAWATDVRSTSFTPDASTDILSLGFFVIDPSSATHNSKARFQTGPSGSQVDNPDTQTNDAFNLHSAADATDEVPWLMWAIDTGISAAHFADIDAHGEGSTRKYEDRQILMIDLELAAAPADLGFAEQVEPADYFVRETEAIPHG